MQSPGRLGVPAFAVSLALLVASAPAHAARKPITGKLSKPGYTVIALAANGRATSVRAGRGKFRLRPPAARVTLHLRGSNGLYAGPILVGRSGKRAIVGVVAGAKLGNIKVRRGYARVSGKLARKWIDRARWARARNGVPVGAGVFGRVRSRNAHGPRDDRDLDGIPDAFDIDDDGDLILDNLDRSTAVRAAQTGNEAFTTRLDLAAGLENTGNVNAGSTDQQIDVALPSFGRLDMQILPGDSAQLNCGGAPDPNNPNGWIGGLVYCTRGGTGRVFQPGVVAPPRFPDCCDPDGDGDATMVNSVATDPVLGPLGVKAMMLAHGATAAQIGTGNVLIERVTAAGVERQFPTTIQYVFATVPALASFSDGQGPRVTVSYPVAAPDPATGKGGGLGTRENPFPVKARPNGDVVLAVTFWRPQRRSIPPETAKWIDTGGLNYQAGIADMGLQCPQGAFSETDPNLTLAPAGTLPAGGFSDLAADQPANATNTFTYTLNLSQCLKSPIVPGPNGPQPQPGFTFNPGEKRGFKFAGVSPNGPNGGEAEQQIFFKRQ